MKEEEYPYAYANKCGGEAVVVVGEAQGLALHRGPERLGNREKIWNDG